MAASFQKYANVPSAILSDGLIPIPLWAVTTMQLSEKFHMPAIGQSGSRAIASVHDDSVQLTGLLIGPERYVWKLALEQMAEVGRRGSALAKFTGGKVSGLVLVTSMTIRTDMQIEDLTFTASAAKRDTLDVGIRLVHMPLPGPLSKLLDVVSLGIGALADGLGN